MRELIRLLQSVMPGLMVLLFLAAPPRVAADDNGMPRLMDEIKRIENGSPGRIGVYIKRLEDGQEVKHRADRNWYLASTIKVPVAISVLQQVEAGALALGQELALSESDFVDGAGELLYMEPGTRLTIDELLRHMIQNSDSTATDMLIRQLGEEAFNRHVRGLIDGPDLGRITTILQVRYDAYSEIHTAARQLSNRDFIELKSVPTLAERYAALLERLDLNGEEPDANDIFEAFERYYARGFNSGPLTVMGALLERLVRGELLNEENTDRLLRYMENVTTGDDRIKAGLPPQVRFAQKTGTQIGRACNVGVLHPRDLQRAVVVVACAEGFEAVADAERAFARLGEGLDRTGFAD